MKRIPFMRMFRMKTSLHHPGPVLRKTGGSFAQRMTGGLEGLYGLVSIIVVNLHPISGPTSTHILASWICVVSRKIFITIINHGGLIKMYCTFLRIGTGKEKKANL